MSTITLFLYVSTLKSKDGTRKFRKVSTKAIFNGENGEEVTKYVDVRFTEDAFKGSPISEKDLKRGKLTVDASKVGLPIKWEITKDENGKDVYPVCWIRGGIVKFEEVPYNVNQSRFVCDESSTEEVELDDIE